MSFEPDSHRRALHHTFVLKYRGGEKAWSTRISAWKRNVWRDHRALAAVLTRDFTSM